MIVVFVCVITLSQSFKCETIDLTIPDSYVNDYYCDCPDGSDERQTGFCPGTIFKCENVGSTSKEIDSRFVGDGICDCCDGSDEAQGVCANRCKEETQGHIDEVDKEIKTIESFIQFNRNYQSEGKKTREHLQQTLNDKKTEIERMKEEKVVETLDEEINKIKEDIEHAKTQHEERLDQLEDEYKDVLEKNNTQNKTEDVKEEIEHSGDQLETNKTTEKEKTEEELRLEEYHSKVDEEKKTFEEDKRTKEKEKMEKEKKQRDRKSEIEKAEKTLWEVEQKQKAKVPLNYCDDFFFMNELTNNRYKLYYGFNVTQNGNINIGSYDRTTEEGDVYINGDICKVGTLEIIRSATVSKRCGAKPEIISAEEPETCKYKIVINTPCACTEESLTDLVSKKSKLEAVRDRKI
ncbi:glucosidase II beta subunit, putative [Entamoeba invadens IP1]|uniref:Glucosidase 2 subunit beta n=1 Tax=Entamoeba invadens IP1 TaxID=370355 RepID=A0A0A1UGB2_ENTIV|nr:glucosidase II beta subunit, putative [Entamoeba invadens IP1]ELP94728.1 glucosidase II beta subunit, putative [Entamoeba invadens IP1]|eukprot:XP_004261499.1 glucosidase II beta subunit, putative [Entamoeba invadens IP1]